MASVLDSVVKALSTGQATADRVQQDFDDAKQQIATAYAVNTTLQLVSTIAVCVIAYTSWQNRRKG